MLRPCPFLHAQQLFLRGLVLAVDRCYPPDRIDVVFPLLYHTTKHVLLRLLANHCVFVVPVGVPLSFDLVHHLIVCNLFCTQTAQEDRKKKKEDIDNRTSKQLKHRSYFRRQKKKKIIANLHMVLNSNFIEYI